jgi:hypothetical protein
MTIASGSFALKRFRLLSHNKDTPLAWIEKKIQQSFISPLQIEDTVDESVGFCHPFTGEPKLNSIHSLIYDNALLFGLRFDKKKIPTTFLKLQLINALESLGHGIEDEAGRAKKISKKIRDNLKEKMKEELLKATLPAIRLVEILWHLDTNEIWLLSTSASVVEQFEKIFFETFELILVHITAGTAHVDFERIQLGLDVDLKPFLDLEPTSLFNFEHIDEEKKLPSREILPPF